MAIRLYLRRYHTLTSKDVTNISLGASYNAEILVESNDKVQAQSILAVLNETSNIGKFYTGTLVGSEIVAGTSSKLPINLFCPTARDNGEDRNPVPHAIEYWNEKARSSGAIESKSTATRTENVWFFLSMWVFF